MTGRDQPADKASDKDTDARGAASNEPPVDGPGATEDNDEAGGTSFDEPGGDEHGG